jgi:Flavin containing amine oxidoreductase
MTARHVVVIGGGLAGITAAIALREAGVGVTVLEARPWLGGATCSFSRGGLAIDNGQHIFLRCCTAYRELLARLGMTGSATIQERFDVTVLSGSGQHGAGEHGAGEHGQRAGRARLRRTALPGPLHMGRALAGYPFLSPGERLGAIRAALAMRFADPAAPGLDRQRLGDWLAAHGQGEHARRMLWDLFIVSTLNIHGDDANAALAATVIKTALLGGRDAADIGIPAVPLGDLHGQAAASLLGRLGAQVRLGTKVTAVTPGPSGGFVVRTAAGADNGATAPGGRVEGRSPEGAAGADGSGTAATGTGPAPAGGPEGAVISADGVVLAVPSGPAARLAPPAAAGGAVRWAELGSSPIVNVHVIYDRRVTRLPLAAAVDSPVQWVFDKTRQAGVPAGQYLAVSVSAADSYVDVPVAALRELFLPALADLFPAAREARVADFFVTRERRATFRQGPGCGSLRPGAATSLPGLALAGAWTDTGWPDTMEGAVRSGHSAAQVLISQLATGPAAQQAAPAAATQAPARAAS